MDWSTTLQFLYQATQMLVWLGLPEVAYWLNAAVIHAMQMAQGSVVSV